MFSWGLTSLTFSDGRTIELEPASTLMLIGPNSAGKSVALRNVLRIVQGESGSTAVVSSVQVFRTGDPDEADAWLAQHYPVVLINEQEHFVGHKAAVQRFQLPSIWVSSPYMSNASLFLMHLLDAQTRLLVTNYTNNIDLS